MNDSFSQERAAVRGSGQSDLGLRPSKSGPITNPMRKCAACEYLLFGDGDTCNHCGAELPRVTAAATTATVPAAAAPVVAAPAPAAPSWRDRLPSTPPAAGAAWPVSPPTGPASAPSALPPPGRELWHPPSPPVVTAPARSNPAARLA